MPSINRSMFEKILRGQAELDRLKQEIVWLTALLSRFVNIEEAEKDQNFRKNGIILPSMSHKRPVWILELIGTNRTRLRISWWPDVFLGDPPFSMDEGSRYITPSPVYVKQIHGSLPALLEGMIEYWPEIKNKLHPFIEAGN